MHTTRPASLNAMQKGDNALYSGLCCGKNSTGGALLYGAFHFKVLESHSEDICWRLLKGFFLRKLCDFVLNLTLLGYNRYVVYIRKSA